MTRRSMVNRTGWGSADLRQQHLFVLEAGDPRDVSCKSEKHSSRSICICLYVLNLFEYLITSTHANSHELLLSFPCVPEILRTHIYCIPCFLTQASDSRIFISALTKRAVTLELFALSCAKTAEGQRSAVQSASCVQRQGEREGSQALGLPR